MSTYPADRRRATHLEMPYRHICEAPECTNRTPFKYCVLCVEREAQYEAVTEQWRRTQIKRKQRKERAWKAFLFLHRYRWTVEALFVGCGVGYVAYKMAEGWGHEWVEMIVGAL